MAWLLPLLGLLAGLAKAVADAQAHGSPRLLRWFPRWAGPDSWKLKYAGADPTRGPRFPLATTLLVFATDLWHFLNLVGWLSWATLASLACWLGWGSAWWLAGALALSKLIFQPLYSFLRKA